jgi:hypothetical protein
MHIPATPMPTSEDTQGHAQEQGTAHRAPNDLGMLLSPPANSNEAVEHGHSRGLLPKKDVCCTNRTPPSTNTMVTHNAITNV